MSGNEITLGQLYDEIIRNRNVVEASETRLLMKIEEFKKKVEKLEKENIQLKEELEKLSRKEKKNNVIIFGLQISEELTPNTVCQKINELLDVDIKEADLNDTYKLGKNPSSPIKVELISYLTKKYILDQCHKLKGKNVSIVHDQTQLQRKNNKILRQNLLKAREDGNNVCYIKNERLFVNGQVYEVEDLVPLAESETSTSNSAPPTPTVTSNIAQIHKLDAKTVSDPISTQRSNNLSNITPKKGSNPTTKENIINNVSRRTTRKNSTKT